MNTGAYPEWRSIKTRATLLTLVIFVIGIWSMAFYSIRTLRLDMQALLGHQQYSAISILAREINHELIDRMSALETVANTVNAAMLENPPSLQALLEQRPVLQGLFSGGVLAYRIDGTVIADVPLSANRIGTNYLFDNSVAAALNEGS